MKIRPVGDELLHADGCTEGRTDGRIAMTMLIVASRNFANAPKIPISQVKRGYSIKISLCLI